MSTPPIYPKGYDPEWVIDTKTVQIKRVTPGGWPTMLGLLTIIGDAVRGVPWGSAEASPVLPEVGSVWITDGLPFVVAKVEDAYVWPEHYAWRRDQFRNGTLTPATVIPTDEYQAMQERLDGISELEKRYSELRTRAAKLEVEVEWLSEGSAAISESVATPPADREQTGAERYLADRMSDPEYRAGYEAATAMLLDRDGEGS